MLERFAKLLALIFIAVTLLDGCAYFTKSGRQQLAYEKYVRKCSKNRDRQRAKMKAPRIPKFEPSEPKETTQLSGSPQSVTSPGESQAGNAGSQAAPTDSAPPQEPSP
ncbi:MAG: hypothetical protein ABR514_02260 [Chthoniobacterales bacterium]